jgi:hypothetical protein
LALVDARGRLFNPGERDVRDLRPQRYRRSECCRFWISVFLIASA